MTADTIFDLASLTKPLATATAILQLAERGRLDLDKPAASYWPEFGQAGKGAITIRQLLLHSAGLPADLSLRRPWRGEKAAMAEIAATKPAAAPGNRFLYSDVGYIALGEIVRRISGEPLDRYAAAHIYRPLGMRDTGFHPPASKLARTAPTDREEGAMRRGQVQDPTAFRMGGVRGTCRAVRNRRRSRQIRRDDAGRRRSQRRADSQSPDHRPDDRARDAARRGQSRIGLGRGSPLCRYRDRRDGPRRLWPYRLYRHAALDRPGPASFPDHPDQQAAPERQWRRQAAASAHRPGAEPAAAGPRPWHRHSGRCGFRPARRPPCRAADPSGRARPRRDADDRPAGRRAGVETGLDPDAGAWAGQRPRGQDRR